MQTHESLAQPVASLSGIGPQSSQRLQKLGVFTVQDLLFHLPHRYEDRTQIYPINTLTPGMSVLIAGTVEFTDILQTGRHSLICRITDQTGYLTLRFFHFTARQQSHLSPGTLISCFGEIRYGYQGLEIIHPEYKVISSTENITEDSLTPIYPLTEGLRQNTLRKAIKQAMTLYLQLNETSNELLPQEILDQFNYPCLSQALKTIHSPPQPLIAEQFQQGSLPALKRLAFEELLAHHLTLLTSKQSVKKWQAPIFNVDHSQLETFTTSLPFQLTHAQKNVIKQILTDCRSGQPMLRLVQGDVGSGKTIVAAFAVLLAITNQQQVAIMAPTELLAEQHFNNFTSWFLSFNVEITLLTAQLKGKARTQTLQAIADGTIKIIIGTHALFQDQVSFDQLGLIIIDEQHRFGVHQRLALRKKGQTLYTRPHQLVMTATPIPRTLAMLQYSDLDISIIDELPPGRKPVITRVIPNEKRNQVISKINQWTEKSFQTYWVCTLIEESDILQCEAAENTLTLLRQALPDVRIALIHGRMKTLDKETIMQAFKNHEYDLLVATTVIEVGVDVPNANLMVIENAERLGLSQLHQLRGRVGRGNLDSYCLLMYQSPLSEKGRERLGVLRETNDGFLIAEKDLQLRGPGEVMGTRQTGQIQLKIANLDRDSDLLVHIQEAANIICNQYPQNVQAITNRWLGQSTHYAEV